MHTVLQMPLVLVLPCAYMRTLQPWLKNTQICPPFEYFPVRLLELTSYGMHILILPPFEYYPYTYKNSAAMALAHTDLPLD